MSNEEIKKYWCSSLNTTSVFVNVLKQKPEIKFELKDLSEDEIKQIIFDYSSNFYDPDITTTLTKIFEKILEEYQQELKHVELINPEAQAEITFKQIQAQFLDRLKAYCTKIISAENVQFGHDGSINAIIHAENGSFNIRTIYARTVIIFKHYTSELL